ncbi:MAG TPA: hypothetical protein VE821_02975, partial [Pyrinomonadaceae bacterium]|nr:hypothetical protein [Pyrinomonadaceae bacterium]
YFIAVDGLNAQTGFVALSWQLNGSGQLPIFDPLANNNIANAQAISGSAGSATGTNTGADKQQGEPNHASNVGGSSVWYRWHAPSSGNVTFSTAGSGFDTLLAAYTLINPNNAVSFNNLATPAIASNDDNTAGGTLTSSITFNATAGTDYFIAVDGTNDGHCGTSLCARTGKIVLTWRSLISISGHIVGGGNGLPSVIVRLSGDASQETRTDGAGYYAFTNLAANGNYTITPSFVDTSVNPAQSASFSPAQLTLNSLTADFTSANFSAIIQGASSVTISGVIKFNDVGVSGVVILQNGQPRSLPPTATAGCPDGQGGRVVCTDGLGAYTLPNLTIGNNYTVAPSSNAYSFTPPNYAFNPLNSDVLNAANFTATQGFNISGQAFKADKMTPFPDVTITATR